MFGRGSFLHTQRSEGGDYERKEFAFSDYGVNIGRGLRCADRVAGV